MVTSASLLLCLAGQHVNAAGTTGQPGKTGTHPHDDSAESPSGCDTNQQGPNMTQWHETERPRPSPPPPRPRTLESNKLQNARTLIEKLQGLNANLQHQVTALHSELARANEHANELRAQLAQQADPEPDIDTVPLADLLEAIGTYLEHGQAVTIRGSYEPVRDVDIHAMALSFRVSTHEASEALTYAHELAQCQIVEAGA